MILDIALGIVLAWVLIGAIKSISKSFSQSLRETLFVLLGMGVIVGVLYIVGALAIQGVRIIVPLALANWQGFLPPLPLVVAAGAIGVVAYLLNRRDNNRLKNKRRSLGYEQGENEPEK